MKAGQKRRRRCLNWDRCRRHAAGLHAYCGPCHFNDAEARLGRQLAQLAPGGVLELGHGWRIVRAAGDTGPGYMPRSTAAMDFGGEPEGGE